MSSNVQLLQAHAVQLQQANEVQAARISELEKYEAYFE